MTNVPTGIRNIWTDLYKLFDNHFLMDFEKQEDLDSYWKDAMQILNKYTEMPGLIDLVSHISEFIYYAQKLPKTGQET